jgi:hypothetical protein
MITKLSKGEGKKKTDDFPSSSCSLVIVNEKENAESRKKGTAHEEIWRREVNRL